jgi:hypothetical protein
MFILQALAFQLYGTTCMGHGENHATVIAYFFIFRVYTFVYTSFGLHL